MTKSSLQLLDIHSCPYIFLIDGETIPYIFLGRTLLEISIIHIHLATTKHSPAKRTL